MRVLLIHKKLENIPLRPSSWDGFGDYKNRMKKHMDCRISYEGLRLRAERWPIEGEYRFVIDENGSAYLKDGVEYQIHNLDGDRIRVPDLEKAVADEQAFINENITEAVAMFVVDDGPSWLADHGFSCLDRG